MITDKQILVYSNPRLFEPRLFEHDPKFQWLKDLLTNTKGKERGDVIITVVKRELGPMTSEKREVMVSEILASMVFRWNGVKWEGIFGTDNKELIAMRREAKIK